MYREYSRAGVCLFHGAYSCNSVQRAADTITAGTVHRATRRRACSAQHATTGDACLHVGLPLRHHRLRLENCTARRTNANKHNRSARARHNGASAHWAPPDVRGQPSECAAADGWRRRHAASHAHGTARPRWATLKSRRRMWAGVGPVSVQWMAHWSDPSAARGSSMPCACSAPAGSSPRTCTAKRGRVPQGTPEYPAAAGGQVLKASAQVWAG